MPKREMNMMRGLRMVLEDSEVGNPSKNHIVKKNSKASKNHMTTTSNIPIRTRRIRMITIHITRKLMSMLGNPTAREKQIVAGVNITQTGKGIERTRE